MLILGIPQAPRPPPVPLAPPLPPTPRKVDKSEVNPSLEILNKMQSRLRSRIKRKPPEKGGELVGVAMEDNSRDVDIKVSIAVHALAD